MRFTKPLTIAMIGAILSLNAQAQNAGPFLWTSYIDYLGNYLQSNSQCAAVSRFTPGVAITVTRVQLQAAFGSYIYPHSTCSPLPKISVTDGTTKYVLAIPHARLTRPYPFSVDADSGPIAVGFPANAELRLSVLPGEKDCNPGSINVNVQYSVK